MSKLEELISLAEPLKKDCFPFPAYSDTENKLFHVIYEIEKDYPEYDLKHYHEILESHKIEWGSRSMENADVSEMDMQGVLALFMGIVRGEHFCDGTILSAIKSGAVLRWLERLKILMQSNFHKITIQKKDITTLKVDVIVNAANTSLLGGGGVDGAIHRAAGPKLLEECRTLHGAKTGEVKSTDAYNLPAKKVYHTPGPRWSGSPNDARLLANCWKNSLALAKEQNMHSIAFPSISTGIYGYPLAEAASIAMKEVIYFINQNPDYDIEIIIAAFDDKTKAAYENALQDVINQ